MNYSENFEETLIFWVKILKQTGQPPNKAFVNPFSSSNSVFWAVV